MEYILIVLIFFRWIDKEVITNNFIFLNRTLYFLMHRLIYFGILYKETVDYINQKIINLEDN